MQEIEEYRNRIRQATSMDEKKAIAAELHCLADTFDEGQKVAYEAAMRELREDIRTRMEMIDPIMNRAKAILERHSQPTK